MPTEGNAGAPGRAASHLQFMDEGFSGVARTWSDGASGGDLVSFFVYLGLQSIYFKMDSLRTLRDLSLPGDWMVKLDLRHAYLVVGIHPQY